MNSTKLNILLFYVFLLLVITGITWASSRDEDKMINTLGAAVVVVGICILLWQNKGQKMIDTGSEY